VPARKEELAKAILTFDIDRCVTGTKLETYFLDRSLATRWTTFADELTLFSLGSISPNLEERLYPGFSKDLSTSGRRLPPKLPMIEKDGLMPNGEQLNNSFWPRSANC
jgi:hypothetical protein